MSASAKHVDGANRTLHGPGHVFHELKFKVIKPDHGSVVERLAGPCCEDQVWIFGRDIGLAFSYDPAFAVSSQNTDGG